MKAALQLLVVWLACWAAGSIPARAAEATADPHQQLKQILGSPEYQRWKLKQYGNQDWQQDVEDSALLRVLRRWGHDFSDWLDRLLDRLFGHPQHRRSSGDSWLMQLGGWSTIFTVLGWVLLAVVVIVLAFYLYRTWQHWQPPVGEAEVLSREQVRRALEDGEALALTGSGWLDEAQRLAAQRDTRAVYRALYLALLSGLHAGGKIDFRKNRTNWVYVDHYRGLDAERHVFAGLTGLFDQVWYGLRPAEAQRLAEVRQQVAGLLQEEGRGPEEQSLGSSVQRERSPHPTP